MDCIRVATWNPLDLGAQHAPGPSDGSAAELLPELHLLATRRMLRRIRADVVALQEVFSDEGLDAAIEGTPYARYFRTPLDPDPEVERSQVILSRFPLRDYRLHRQRSRLSWFARGEGAGHEVRWNRPIVEVSIDLPGIGQTRLLTVHLKSKRPSETPGLMGGPGRWTSLAAHGEGMALSSLKRVGQALELRRLVDGIFDRYEDARVMVVGDFNDTLDSVPLSIIRGSYVEARNLELWDRELYPVELSLPDEKRFTLLHDGRPQMIDHVLISRALLASFHSARVLNETIRDHWATPRGLDLLPESDHAPVVAEFEIGTPGT